MAGDWIKMRGNLWDDPRVARLCDATEQPEAMIVGGLYWLWATADQHTESGILPGLTLRAIDRKTGIQGFGQALCDVGWLADHPEGVRIVRFEEHNGSSAKRRGMEAQRKANSRAVSASDADNVRTESAENGTPCVAREEKRREEKEIHPHSPRKRGSVHGFPPGFDSFWSAYPRKTAKPKAAQAFARIRPDEALLAQMLAAIARESRGEQWLREGGKFIPHPASWLNAERWNDENAVVQRHDPFAGAA